MLKFLILRDFKIRFKQSALGFLWAILQPLSMTLIFTMIMSRVIPSSANFESPYALSFLSGLMAWNYFSKLLSNGTLTIVNEADLVKKIYFPRLILPLYQVLSLLTDFLIALFIFFLLCLYYQFPISSNIILLPFYCILTMLFGCSISLWLGPINVRFRDIQILIPLLTQLLFIATPVMYPSKLFNNESWLSTFYQFNPMVGIIEGFRYCLINEGNPFQTIHYTSASFIIVIFISGILFFNRSQHKFADII